MDRPIGLAGRGVPSIIRTLLFEPQTRYPAPRCRDIKQRVGIAWAGAEWSAQQPAGAPVSLHLT